MWKPIDKSLPIDKIMLIDCIDQSIEIDTRNFFPKSVDIYWFHRFLTILSIDEKLLTLV